MSLAFQTFLLATRTGVRHGDAKGFNPVANIVTTQGTLGRISVALARHGVSKEGEHILTRTIVLREEGIMLRTSVMGHGGKPNNPEGAGSSACELRYQVT